MPVLSLCLCRAGFPKRAITFRPSGSQSGRRTLWFTRVRVLHFWAQASISRRDQVFFFLLMSHSMSE